MKTLIGIFGLLPIDELNFLDYLENNSIDFEVNNGYKVLGISFIEFAEKFDLLVDYFKSLKYSPIFLEIIRAKEDRFRNTFDLAELKYINKKEIIDINKSIDSKYLIIKSNVYRNNVLYQYIYDVSTKRLLRSESIGDISTCIDVTELDVFESYLEILFRRGLLNYSKP